MRDRFPFWVLPLSLLAFLVGFLLWSVLKINHVGDRNTVMSIEKSMEAANNLKAKAHLNIDLASINAQSDMERYKSGLYYFSKQHYYESSAIFKSLFEERKETNPMGVKAGVYYAYSLLLYGQMGGTQNDIEDARDIFNALLKKVPQNSDLYSRVILGYAKSCRYTRNYAPGIDTYLKQYSLTANDFLKRQIFLELGYYYFISGNYDDSIRYFVRSNYLVDMPFVYDKLLNQGNNITFLIQLLKYKLVPSSVYSMFSTQIQQEFFKEAASAASSNNLYQARAILKEFLDLFPSDYLTEEASFLCAAYSQKLGNNEDAVQFYLKTIQNSYTDRDSEALYQLALIYMNNNQAKKALYYFKMIIKEYPNTNYALESEKWVDRLTNSNDIDDDSSIIDEADSPKKNGEPTDDVYSDYKSLPKETHSKSRPVINLNVKNEINGSNNQDSNNQRSETNQHVNTKPQHHHTPPPTPKKRPEPAPRPEMDFTPQEEPQKQDYTPPKPPTPEPKAEPKKSQDDGNSSLEDDFAKLKGALGNGGNDFGSLLQKKYN